MNKRLREPQEIIFVFTLRYFLLGYYFELKLRALKRLKNIKHNLPSIFFASIFLLLKHDLSIFIHPWVGQSVGKYLDLNSDTVQKYWHSYSMEGRKLYPSRLIKCHINNITLPNHKKYQYILEKIGLCFFCP